MTKKGAINEIGERGLGVDPPLLLMDFPDAQKNPWPWETPPRRLGYPRPWKKSMVEKVSTY